MLAVWAGSAGAHHAISAYYDSSKQTRLEGTVSEFQFVSPHPMVFMTVAAGDEAERWRLEMDNRSELSAIGIRRDTVRPGDRIRVSGSLARDGSRGLYVLHLTRPSDGFTYEQVGGSPRIVKWKN